MIYWGSQRAVRGCKLPELDMTCSFRTCRHVDPTCRRHVYMSPPGANLHVDIDMQDLHVDMQVAVSVSLHQLLKIRQKVRFATSTFNFKNKSRISNTFPQAKMIVDVLQGAIFKISLHSTKISRSLLVQNLNSACPKRHHMSTCSSYMSTSS